MALTDRELNQLKKIVELASMLVAKAQVSAPSGSTGASKTARAVQKNNKKSESKLTLKAEVASSSAATGKRPRRSGAELVAFRKLLIAERKRGTSVADLSKQHGVSAAYIYQL